METTETTTVKDIADHIAATATDLDLAVEYDGTMSAYLPDGRLVFIRIDIEG